MKIVVIILCIVGVVSAIPSLPSTKGLPPYLSHIDNTFLQSKLDLAMERHEKAIQKAITNFDTDSVSASTNEERERFLNSLQFDEFNIVADGYHLPDFHNNWVISQSLLLNVKHQCLQKKNVTKLYKRLKSITHQ